MNGWPQSRVRRISRTPTSSHVYFAPKLGLDEDPVSGSAHAVLAPYCIGPIGFGQNSLTGFQASGRPGLVSVEVLDDRVIVSGRAVTVLDGILKPTPG